MESDTQALSIQAPPEAVLDLVGDPRNLPRWAPGFARAVRADGEDWIVDTGEAEIRRHIPVSRERGTVDFVAGPGARRGLFTRVVANGDGSELVFTLVFPAGADVAARRAVIARELATVKELCEG
jgi:hypothetical protein